MRGPKEAPGGGRSVWSSDGEVVDDGQCLQPLGFEVVQAVMPQGKLAVATFDGGARSLKKVSTGRDHSFHMLHVGLVQLQQLRGHRLRQRSGGLDELASFLRGWSLARGAAQV